MLRKIVASGHMRLQQPKRYEGSAPKSKETHNRAFPTYNSVSTLAIDQRDFEGCAGLRAPCTVLLSPKTNCLVLVNGPRARGTTVDLKYHRQLVIIRLQPTIIPPLAYSVEVRDVLSDPQGLLIIRWPLRLYTQSVRTARDLRRSVRSQQRESELIEATYHPLTQRFEPYPFFVPKQPLDSLWSPTA